MKKWLKIIGIVVLLLLLLSGGITYSLRIPSVQDYIVKKTIAFLSYRLGTPISIRHFEWSLFRNIDLEDFYLSDKNNDTVIFVSKLNADISYWSLTQRTIKIKSIKLENAKVHLVADTAGNLNISALFGGNSAPKPAPVVKDSAAKSFNAAIDLKSLSLVNTDFSYSDNKKHFLLKVYAMALDVSLNQLALPRKLVDIHSIAVEQVKASFESHIGMINALPTPPADSFFFLPAGWFIRWDDIRLAHSQFVLLDHTLAPASKGIDFAHLDITDIALQTAAGSVIRDSIKADIRLLAAKEKSGFEVKTLHTVAKIATDEIILDKLLLETNHSRVSKFLSFKYNRFDDFSHFVEKVTINAEFDKTKLSLNDLNFFAKNLDALAHNTIQISGKMKGKVSHLQANGITLSTSTGTYLRGSFYTDGLPNIYNTSLNLRIEQLVTSTADIRQIYPAASYPPSFNTLGIIRFQGDFDGFLTDFVTKGHLYTDIGSASSDLNFKYNKEKNTGSYSGNLALADFDLGKWFNDPLTLGKVSLSATIAGSGLTLPTIRAKLAGDVSSLTIRGYNYKDLKVDGVIKGKYFSGNLVANDAYLDADFNGTVDFNGKIPQYNFISTIRKAMLKELHLSKDTLNIAGGVTANFIGKKPDDIVGTLILNQLMIQHGHESILLKNITASSELLNDGQKQVKLVADNLEANIRGKFSFTGLPKALKSYLDYTFTKDYEDTAKIAPQQFTFDIKIFDSSALSRVIDPRFKEIRNTVLSGELNTENHIFNIKGAIPELVFDKYLIKRAVINGTSRNGIIDFLTTIDKVYTSDSLMMDTVVLHSVTEANDFKFDLIMGDAKDYNKANLTAYVTPKKGSLDLHFAPSFVWLGGNQWKFQPNNIIHIKGKQIESSGLVFESGKQSIHIDSYLKNDTSTSLKLSVTETSLADFINIFSRKVKDLTATVNGTITIENILNKPAVIANIEAKDCYLGKIPLGILKVASDLDETQKKVNITATLLSDTNDLTIAGFYTIAKNEINLDADIRSGNLSFLNHPLFNKYVRNVSGSINAKLSVKGSVKAPVLTGLLRIKNATVNVTFLNTTYRLEDEDIEVKDGYFDVGEIDVIDRFGNKAFGKGRIYHENFRKFTLDLHVRTDQAEFINTSAKDVPQFYGEGIGKGNIDFTGTIPFVNIRAYAQVKQGTHCYIPINSSYETNKYSFYRFVNSQKDTLKTKGKEEIRQSTGVNFILDLDVTPDGILDIQLDPTAGDVLSSRGRGNIKIELLRGGEFNIYGLYEIAQGSYLFTLQNIINKKFELDPGGAISFRGDINNAQLNADAVYQVRTSTYDLIADILPTSSSGSETEASVRSKNRIVTKLLLRLRGVLQSPEVSFDIRPVDPDALIRTYVDNKLQLIRGTDAEMNKQVFGLLVMNRFLPTNSASSAANDPTSSKAIGGSVANTVSEFLTSQLSLYMSSFFDNINVKDFDVNFNFRQYDQQYQANTSTATTTDYLNTRRELQLALTKRFFHNRLSLNVGGNLDFGDSKTDANGAVVSKGTYVTGDFQIEYVLDKNGAWSAKAYNKGDYDNFNQRNRNRTGIGITYRQDFDKWIDLFRRPRKPKPQILPAAAKPED